VASTPQIWNRNRAQISPFRAPSLFSTPPSFLLLFFVLYPLSLGMYCIFSGDNRDGGVFINTLNKTYPSIFHRLAPTRCKNPRLAEVINTRTCTALRIARGGDLLVCVATSHARLSSWLRLRRQQFRRQVNYISYRADILIESPQLDNETPGCVTQVTPCSMAVCQPGPPTKTFCVPRAENFKWA